MGAGRRRHRGHPCRRDHHGAGRIAAWGDAITVVPAVLWERFAAHETLRDCYAAMAAWVDVVRDRPAVGGRAAVRRLARPRRAARAAR
ncbi:hypothetical protein ACFY78_10390 [Streptomyces olindensis]|uniref:alpha-L-rhamnosidase-related protein n=1 Tax=Streptomyces olindensis TaxID=358823 RepID=UPI003684C963